MPEKITKNVSKDAMDKLMQSLTNKQLASAEFKYLIDKKGASFKCESVENFSDLSVQSVSQWNNDVAKYILNKCIDQAKSPPDKDFTKNMTRSNETLKIFTFNSNNSKIKVTSHYMHKPTKNEITLVHIFEDDKFIYTYKDSTPTQ